MTDRQTDRQTDTASRHIPCLCIASRGKNYGRKLFQLNVNGQEEFAGCLVLSLGNSVRVVGFLMCRYSGCFAVRLKSLAWKNMSFSIYGNEDACEENSITMLRCTSSAPSDPVAMCQRTRSRRWWSLSSSHD